MLEKYGQGGICGYDHNMIDETLSMYITLMPPVLDTGIDTRVKVYEEDNVRSGKYRTKKFS